MNQLMQRIVKGNYAPISSKYSADFRKMVDWCLQKEPSKRPSIKQLLAYPLMRDSLDQLEQNLMLATQCKIRLNDIIDFETGMDNRHESPSTSPRAEAKAVPPGMSPGQAAAMAMAKQMAPSSPASHQPTGGALSPKPSANLQPNNYLDQQRQKMDRMRQQQYGRSPSIGHDLQPIEKKQMAPDNRGNQMGKDPRAQNLSDDVAERANRFDADMKRVDAIIAKYGKNTDPSAKETIHAFMRRKQEEYMQRQREEAAKRDKRNDLRQKEMQRVLEQQRNLASPGRPKSPQRSPMRMRAESESVPVSGRGQTPPSRGANNSPQAGHARDLAEGRRQRMQIAANSPRLILENQRNPSQSPTAGRATSQPSSRPTSPSRQLGLNSDPTSAAERAKAMRLQIEEKKRNQARATPSPPLSPRRAANAPLSPQYNPKYNVNHLEPLHQRPLSPQQAESPRHRLGVLPPVSNPSPSPPTRADDATPVKTGHQDANKSPSREDRDAISPRRRQYLANAEKQTNQMNPAVPSTLDSLRNLRNEKREGEAAKPGDKLALLKQRQSLPSRGNVAPPQRAPAGEGRPRPLSPGAVDEPSPRRNQSPGSPQSQSPGARTNSVDGYAEMLQHLKDLLQKRKIYHDNNRNPPSTPSGYERRGSQLSPPALQYTKPSAQVSLAPLNGPSESSDDDEDFEDAVPLSPVRCTELNDTYNKQKAEKEQAGNVYTADAFLHGQEGEEEELDEDGYTGYY
ncbi:protein kinase [Angomonas deanei]|uniref:non-specific serine/threonine protein kinase n=1 Tax=Angomonas deanei TaxID=59799 RepID=A0A7G2C9L0_9TRYP|nr:protein kinase [Angomonas deanei]CAD2216426.1 hypothetical protein, conserved [Angomonas deanei]|eukprot:EPY20671.1 protein kinase [Angomonas deanei]